VGHLACIRRAGDLREHDARVIAAAIDAFCARNLGARCGHALATDERGEASAFAHLAWTEREGLLAMCRPNVDYRFTRSIM
jgi:hypothetical protein